MDEFSLNVVTGEAKGGLSQVVGAKAEEVCLSSDLVSDYGSTRKLDHGTDLDLKLYALFLGNLSNNTLCLFAKLSKLRNNRNKRNHDLRLGIETFLLELSSSSGNSTYLHFGKDRILDCQTAAAKTKHGVCLGEAVDLLHKSTLLLDDGRIATSSLKASNLNIESASRLEELMQRRIEQTNDNRQTVHSTEHAKEVAGLSLRRSSQAFSRIASSSLRMKV